MTHFNLNEQWQLYLERMHLDEKVMDPIQIWEAKRAFVAGVTQLFEYLEKATFELDKERGNAAMTRLLRDLNSFWETTPPIARTLNYRYGRY